MKRRMRIAPKILVLRANVEKAGSWQRADGKNALFAFLTLIMYDCNLENLALHKGKALVFALFCFFGHFLLFKAGAWERVNVEKVSFFVF